MKYSFLIPYIAREMQLHNSLLSFVHHYGKRDDFEIVFVEDARNFMNEKWHKEFMDVIREFNHELEIKIIINEDDKVRNPSKAFNMAAEEARGEFFILTNPETFHAVNILNGFDGEFEKSKAVYVLCACRYVHNTEKVNSYEEFKPELGIWYQHSVHQNSQLHWCSSLHRDTYKMVGGFNAERAYEIGKDDRIFLKRLKHHKVPIIVRDDLLTYHIQHEKHR